MNNNTVSVQYDCEYTDVISTQTRRRILWASQRRTRCDAYGEKINCYTWTTHVARTDRQIARRNVRVDCIDYNEDDGGIIPAAIYYRVMMISFAI